MAFFLDMGKKQYLATCIVEQNELFRYWNETKQIVSLPDTEQE